VEVFSGLKLERRTFMAHLALVDPGRRSTGRSTLAGREKSKDRTSINSYSYKLTISSEDVFDDLLVLEVWH